ncbi:Re/Si-specific NAD(P)(+) transhydrogenase subunit alpha [Chitinimonas sp. BJYL2]|uniref:Re/Si-specific NAD(P)(+) transhydrogenase subunit alpha n=1 Tax=Chitinimonas sp. BJYL2 TaxID=2976696 RepID=UPI0022B32B04|nr:Re/Si-specific NAD(P)(+) transhydrogenase subunit alpha [Chitinimonas sp. BJYL2]
MKIAIPRESAQRETRVAATPETVKKYLALGHTVTVQSGAGTHSAQPDSAYADAGASIAPDYAATVAGAGLILKVRAPSGEELAALDDGAAVVALCDPYRNADLPAYAAKRLDMYAMELVPRTTRAQAMDVLSSQANIAGYKAVLLATEFYPRFMPMMMTAAGTVKPARVLILGAGVAGLQAIATAKRLGAVVEAFDVRPAAKEQVESLGGKFVEVALTDEEKQQAETAGGYAREMSDDYKQRQAALVDKHARNADIVITTALIPGRPAPVLIQPETVAAMKPGAVLVDLAVENGGNCPLSKLNEVVTTEGGVKLVGYGNLPGLVACDASALYARNLLNFAALILDKDKGYHVNREDDIVAASLITHGGEVLFGKKA